MSAPRDVIIIDSGGANLASLEYALERLGVHARVSSDAAQIADAGRLILPGVGSARDAMQRLEAARLIECVRRFRRPVLGICLGMQLLFQLSAEGATPCLGVLGGTVEPLQARPGLPVPHMGWNSLALLARDPLLEGIANGEYVYFIHSFAVPPSETTLATAHYGADVSAVVRSGNFWGTQFHPERSGPTGAKILGNFLHIES